MKTVAFCTLGCKVNQYETEAMSALFTQAGYKVVDFHQTSDVYVINTCTVTSTSDQKSRQMIRRARRLNKQAIIAVVGCYAQVAPEEIKNIEGVNVVLGTAERSKIVTYVQQAQDKQSQTHVTDSMSHREFEDLWVTAYHDKARALVKIEEGCNEYCSYCIIPYARGPVRSRPLDSICHEVTALSQNGYSEVVLTGIHIASYGREHGKNTLLDVIQSIAQINGIRRIRLGSLEPRLLTEDFVRAISQIPQVCPHFHLSLQSGCDNTLKHMNRKYTTAQYRQNVALLRQYFDNPAITTDIMVGFPGETEADFTASVAFLKEIAFAEAHVFAYSPRKGTRAAVMPNQIPKAEKERRAKIMADAAKQCRADYLTAHIGKNTEVFVERETAPGIWEGHTPNYIPVQIDNTTDLRHQYIPVTLNNPTDSGMSGIRVTN